MRSLCSRFVLLLVVSMLGSFAAQATTLQECEDTYNNAVTACNVTYDPSVCGADTICQINVLQQQASCTSDAVNALNACTASVPLAPSYSCTGFQSPFDIALSLNKKTNRAIPLKAQLFDHNGALVTPDTLGAALPPVVNVSYSSGGSPAVDDTSLLAPAGQSSSGNQFNFDPTTNTWWFNLSSGTFTAPGTYTVTLQTGDATQYTVAPVCTGTFVRE